MEPREPWGDLGSILNHMSYVGQGRPLRPHLENAIKALPKPELEEWLGSLNKRQRFVVEVRFELNGRPKETLTDIGKKLDVTSERVRQMEAKALLILRKRVRG